MPADRLSTLFVILLTAADTVLQIWPYVVGGILMAVLLSWISQTRPWSVPGWLPPPLALPLSALLGIASPVPTVGTLPMILQLRARGFPARSSLAFVLASSLLNPQLFVLTLGALGISFALAQLGAVLMLSMALGLLFGSRPLRACKAAHIQGPVPRLRPGSAVAAFAGHIGLYFLVGVIIGAALQVLLPQLGLLNWLGKHDWLSTPILGWLGAPFYTCGGSAVPLARSLGEAGLSQGTLLAFLLVGPALRGTTLANLRCLLPRRSLIGCLALLALGGGLLGLGFDHIVGIV